MKKLLIFASLFLLVMVQSLQAQEERILGIDVSHYQGKVKWDTLKNQAVTFAFIKATEGTHTIDPLFNYNWNKCSQAGILKGAYHFFVPTEDPIKQAEHFLNTIRLEKGDLFPVLDLEITGNLSRDELISSVQKWLLAVQEELKVTPIIYTAPSFWDSYMDNDFGKYPLWLAEYEVKKPRIPYGWKCYSFWQYTDKHTFQGMNSHFDATWFTGGIEDIKKLTIN